jgi:two-component system LytT family response regulator
LLAEEPGVDIVGECADGAEAISSIAKLSPDLVFLDAQMPGCDGFEVLARIDPRRAPIIIFVTAHDKFAVKAFEANAIDYLLKPFDEDRFRRAVQRARTSLEDMREDLAGLVLQLPTTPKYISRLAVKCHGRVVFLKVAEVDWMDAEGNYVGLHSGKESHLLRGRLSELEKKLSPEQFFRIHRSTIVNLDRVKEFRPLCKGEGVVVLKDGTQLVASRGCAQKLQEHLDAHL